MGFPRQEYWSGLPFPSPGDLPNPEIKPECPVLADGLFTTDYFTAHQNKTQFSPEPVPPTGSLHKPLILIHQRADRLKTTIREK